jgi:hypothetical protein
MNPEPANKVHLYTTFSGVDITTTINGVKIGTVHDISYRITKQGEGIRSIRGKLTGIVFNHHALHQIMGAGIQYADQIPEFEMILEGSNEVGNIASMKFKGCKIIREKSGVSVDSIITTQTFTFVALEAEPWQPVN